MKRSVLIGLWMLFAVSCTTVDTTTPPADVGHDLEDIQDSVKDSVADLGNVAKKIRGADIGILKGTDRIVAKFPSLLPETSKIGKEVDTIEEQVDIINLVHTGLTEAKVSLGAAKTDADVLRQSVTQLQDQIEEREERIDDLENSLTQSAKSVVMWMLIAGFVCVAVCALMVYSGKPNGVTWGVVGGVVIVLSLTVSFYMKEIASVGAIALLVALAILIYNIWERIQERRAREEVVKTVEHLKPYVPEEDVVKEFGGTVNDGVVGTIQSTKTKEIVARDRVALGLTT